MEVTKAPAFAKALAGEAKTESEYLDEYLTELEFKMNLANRNLQFDEAMRLQEEINKFKNLTNR